VEVQNNAAGMDKEKSPQRPILSLQAFLNPPVRILQLPFLAAIVNLRSVNFNFPFSIC
jgi:hypothetical protein